MWIYILFGLMALINAFLLLQHIHLHKDIRKICDTARDIRMGNFNMHFRLRTVRKDIENLSGELNRLTDWFQNKLARTKFLEEERQRMISNISHDLRTPLTSFVALQ